MRVALALLLLVAAPAHAYKRSVNPGNVWIWWSTRGHTFTVDAQGTPDVPGLAAFTAIRNSFGTWAGASCSDLSFPDLGLSYDPRNRKVGYFPDQQNQNLILFRTANCALTAPKDDDCWGSRSCGNKYDCWLDQDSSVIAKTTTTSNRYTGQILDSDIELNDAPTSTGDPNYHFTANDGPPCTEANQTGCVDIDIQNTVTHEAGHTLGLDHSLVPASTMYASAPPGETSKRTLDTDDLAGICAIYPRGAQTVTSLSGDITLTAGASDDTTGCGCSHAQTGPGAALAALLLFLQLKRRSRTKPDTVSVASTATASSALPESDSAF